VFGAESPEPPDDMLEVFGPDFRLRLPMRPASRSVNLGNSLSAVVLDARQRGLTSDTPLMPVAAPCNPAGSGTPPPARRATRGSVP
jgi:hypothetical protein